MIIDRYLFVTMARASALVILVLLAQSAFINFVDQLDEVGEGSFTTADAVFFTLMLWPSHAFEMFPIAVLLGTMLGLGALANHSELIALRAAGVSMWRFARTGLLTGLVFAVVAAVVGEFIAPPAEQYARTHKAELKDKKSDVDSLSGIWLRDGERIINVVQVQDERNLAGVYTFDFDPTGQELLAIGRAPHAERQAEDTWRLDDYRATQVDGDVATVETVAAHLLETSLDADVLEVSVVRPSNLSLVELWQYARYLQNNDLDSVTYEMAMWNRIANVVAVPLMVLLGLPFVFGPLRTGGNGIRLVVGVLIGVLYYLSNGALADASAVYDVPPVVTAWIPVGLLALAAGIGLIRAR
jgi:lipopolysaccharide export system permease protein